MTGRYLMMDRQKTNFSSCKIIVIMAALVSLYANAADNVDGAKVNWKASVGAEAAHTDNSLKTSRNTQSDTTEKLLTGVVLNRKTADVSIDLNYDAAKETYRDNTQSDRTTVEGAGKLHWQILPAQLYLDVENYRQDDLIDSREADTPQNRDIRNTTSIGPTFIGKLTPRDILVDTIKFSEMDFSDTTSSDNSRQQVTIAYTHATSAVQSIGLSSDLTAVDYDEKNRLDTNFSRYFLTLKRRYSLGFINAAVGTNRADRGTRDDSGGSYYSLSGALRSGEHALKLDASRQLVDSSLGVQGGRDTLTNTTSIRRTNFSITDVSRDTSAQLQYINSRPCARCRADLTLYLEKQAYEKSSSRDEDRKGFSVGFDYRWTPLWDSRLLLSREKTNRATTTKDEILHLASFQTNYHFAKSWRTQFEYALERRDANGQLDSSGFDRGYTEHEVRVGLYLDIDSQ